MNTRCSLCGRHFPVYAQQLKQRRGKVECPQCGGRFDAIAGLLEEAMPGDAGGGEEGPADAGASGSELAPASLFSFDEPKRRRLNAASLAWGAGVLLLVAGLAVQALWWERGTMLQYARVRALADSLCSPFGCAVTPPRSAGAMEPLQPALIQHPEDPGVLLLQLTLINRSREVQALPLLQVELLDSEARTIAARRLPPELYLPPGESPARGLYPGEGKNLELRLASPPEMPSNFRLLLF